MNARAIAIAVALVAAHAPGRARADGASIAVLAGSGSGGWSYGGHTARFEDSLAQDPARIAVAVEGALPLGRWFQLGARGSPFLLRASEGDTHTTLLIARLEAMASVRPPWTAGPYLRVGVGPAALWYDVRVPGLASGSARAAGGSLSLALGGFAVDEGRTEFRMEVEGSAQAWLPSDAGPDWSLTVLAAIGVSLPW